MGRLPAWLVPQVLVLGTVALLTDLGSELAMPLLPGLIAGLGGGALAVGLVDGLADAVSASVQVFAGRRADAFGKRPRWLAWGYGISGALRPLFGLAQAPWQVVAVRSADRVGRGLRKPARSSLLEDAAAPGARGRVFGFDDAMDNLGQVLGPLLALGLLRLWPGDLRRVLLCAAVPGLLAYLLVVTAVREAPRTKPAPGLRLGVLPPPAVRPALLAVGLFTLGNASDLFLLLRIGDAGAALTTLVLLWAAFAGVKVVGALLGGPLADRLGPRGAISLGWAWYALAYLAFARAQGPHALAAVFLLYGLFHGFSEGPQKAWMGALAPEGLKATCFAWLGLATGWLALPAGLLFGGLWQWGGPALAFRCGAALAAAGLAALWVAPGPVRVVD